MIDSHVHSNYSPDSKICIDEGCEFAIQKKLDGLVFTDHFELDLINAEYDFNFDIAKRSKDLDLAREKFGEKLKILKGLEAGFQPHITEELSKNINSYDFDFVINSVHVIDKIDASQNEYFLGRTQQQAYKRYLEEVYASVCKFKNYDVIGHIGYVRRYGDFLDRSMKFFDYKEILDEILKQIVKDDKGIEINSSGYRGVLKTPIPDYDIVSRYIELGGEIITLGSDSHTTETINLNFDIIKEKLKDLNFKYMAYFEERKPKFIKLK